MFSFFGTGLGLTSEKLLCKLFEMTFEHGVHGGKTSKTTCCLDSTLLKHNGHFYSIPWKKKTDWSPPIFLMICERWNVLIFTFWFPHFFLKKQTEKSSPKTNIEEKHQKQNAVWTAPFWIIVDTFTASHGKMNWLIPTYFFKWLVTCGKTMIFTV